MKRKTDWIGNALGWAAVGVVFVVGIYIVYSLADRFWFWTQPR